MPKKKNEEIIMKIISIIFLSNYVYFYLIMITINLMEFYNIKFMVLKFHEFHFVKSFVTYSVQKKSVLK